MLHKKIGPEDLSATCSPLKYGRAWGVPYPDVSEAGHWDRGHCWVAMLSLLVTEVYGNGGRGVKGKWGGAAPSPLRQMQTLCTCILVIFASSLPCRCLSHIACEEGKNWEGDSTRAMSFTHQSDRTGLCSVASKTHPVSAPTWWQTQGGRLTDAGSLRRTLFVSGPLLEAWEGSSCIAVVSVHDAVTWITVPWNAKFTVTQFCFFLKKS